VISYTDIKAVYFYQAPSVFITRMISLQIHSNSGDKITLAFSSLIFAMSDHYATAKSATAAFFGHYYAAVLGAEVVLGFPPSKGNIALWVAITAGVLGYSFYAMWREGMMTTRLEFLTFAGMALFLSLAMAWSFHRNTGSKCKSAHDLFEELSN
jgi:hypothetical protein